MAWVNLNTIYATKSDLNTGLAARVPTSRTINGKALSSNVTLGASDIKLSDSTTLQSAWDSISQKVQYGVEAVTPTKANVAYTKHVTFKTPYNSTPTIQVTTCTGSPNLVLTSVGDKNATGFDIVLYRPNTTLTSVYWFAIGD